MKKLKYFKELVILHNLLFNINEVDIRCDMKACMIINKEIEKLYLMAEEATKFELLYSAIRCASIIVLYQPFYDGNNRTAITFLEYFLLKHRYEINMKELWKNGELMIPILYDEDDIISDATVLNYMKHVKKK